ncbi:hypothetical protein [Aeromicrobium massiliense]|uniref:hypothetical protein n=1 Tax=Aeromicrobium massiliense TaxID=1464554 RepID=UPI0002E3102C|nr:hypothetical protein [Aeromicrobium massiliense]
MAVPALAAVLLLASCSGDADEPEERAEPAACGFVDEATVREVLGDTVNDPTDASTTLNGASDLLGCRWATPVGTALTVTVTRTPDGRPPTEAVAGWSEGCATPQPLGIEDATGGICQDTAFDAAGSELYAVWSDDDLTMRLGLQRDGGAEPGDADKLRAVATDVMDDLDAAGFDEAEAAS